MQTSQKRPKNVDTWKPNFSDDYALSTALDTLVGSEQHETPWLVWLLENPASPVALPGNIAIHRHDCLHAILNIPTQLMGEAEVIGFTMGAATGLKKWHLTLYKFLSSVFYPKSYRFNEDHLKVFDAAIAAGRENKVKDIHLIPLEKMGNSTLGELRKMVLG